MYRFDWHFLWGEPGIRLLHGFVVTVELSCVALVLALVLGLVFGIVRWMRWRVAAPVCWLYVELARNTPPVVQILFWYFSASYIFPAWLFSDLRVVGLEFGAAAFALGLYHGAFYAEICRAGLDIVPKGQYEAARALGLNFRQMLGSIVFPQAGRIMLPALINETVSLIKNTSLAVAIGVNELAFEYRYIDAYAFRGVEALAMATVLYMSVCFLVSGGGRWINIRLSHPRVGHAPIRLVVQE
jgi:polar amino acid transport system permease protein